MTNGDAPRGGDVKARLAEMRAECDQLEARVNRQIARRERMPRRVSPLTRYLGIDRGRQAAALFVAAGIMASLFTAGAYRALIAEPRSANGFTQTLQSL